jgi:hypothetical protein
VDFLEKGYDELKAALTLAQEQMKHFYDQKHRDMEPTVFIYGTGDQGKKADDAVVFTFQHWISELDAWKDFIM